MNDSQFITFIALSIVFGSGLIVAGLVSLGRVVSDKIKEWWNAKN